jgi:hypothetical protein
METLLFFLFFDDALAKQKERHHCALRAALKQNAIEARRHFIAMWIFIAVRNNLDAESLDDGKSVSNFR